jgi:pyocin large subunit-like protein
VSRRATEWAALQRPAQGVDKLVLWAIAHHHSPTAGAFPSTAALIEFTGLTRKVVLHSVARLQRARLVEDTGRRVGKTRQVKVYRLGFEIAETVPVEDR